jgi:hypothetical protein
MPVSFHKLSFSYQLMRPEDGCFTRLRRGQRHDAFGGLKVGMFAANAGPTNGWIDFASVSVR